MITEIRFKKGLGVPSSLKYAEPAVDMLNKILYIGMTEGESGGSDFLKIIDEEKIEEYVDNAIANIKIPENSGGDSTNVTDLTEVMNMINNLHYYCNKDITYDNDNFIIEETDGMLGLDIFCENMVDGVLVIPYDVGDHEHFDVSYSQNITKIIIPRGFNLYFMKEIATDETLVQVFPNLKTIVRIHEDGAVLSYNVEDQSMN